MFCNYNLTKKYLCFIILAYCFFQKYIMFYYFDLLFFQVHILGYTPGCMISGLTAIRLNTSFFLPFTFFYFCLFLIKKSPYCISCSNTMEGNTLMTYTLKYKKVLFVARVFLGHNKVYKGLFVSTENSWTDCWWTELKRIIMSKTVELNWT